MIPSQWLPAAAVLRIICHTEHAEEVHDDLRLFYHFLIAKSGAVARGFYSLADNAHPQHGFANHTRLLNIGSAGVAVIGRHLSDKQWDALVQLVALLCKHYRIEINERTVLVHSEVERVFGIPQQGASDLAGMGDTLRASVREVLFPPSPEPVVFQPLAVGRKRIVGKVENGKWWLPARQIAEACGLLFVGTQEDPYQAIFAWGSERVFVPAGKHVIYGIEYICVPLREFIEPLGKHCLYDERLKSLVLAQPD